MLLALQMAWKFRNEILICCVVGYLAYVFHDRDKLRTEVDILNAKVNNATAQIKLNGDINDAIQKIRITSNNNITAIVKETKPTIPANGAILIAGGVQSSVYSKYSSSNATPTP